MRTIRRCCLLLPLVVLGVASPGRAADWPAFKRDAARSGVTDERLPFPLKLAWVYRAPQPPRPAWPEPGRSVNLLDFDFAPQPVSAGGLVYFGSTADDSVRALDARTGRVVWTVTVGAPVRFAPHIAAGCCYFAADDGVAYCVDAATGTEIWKKRLALNDRQLIAHGRLASRWPCRSGVLVDGDTVYVAAGMWPSEGVYLYALDARTGNVRWCNDTSSYDYLPYPHPPSASFGGPAPQGYLLCGKDVLVVPTGRANPAGFDATTGKLLHFDAMTNNRGGTSVTLAGDTMFVSTAAWQPDQSVRLGESEPQPVDSLAALVLRTGKEEWSYSAGIKRWTEGPQPTRWRSQIAAGIHGRQRAVFSGTRVYAMGDGKAEAYDLGADREVQRRWSVDHPRVYAEALTANALLLGGQDVVTALDVESGKQLWQAPVAGQARGLAVADGRLIVSTDRGTVHCFTADGGAPAPSAAITPATAPALPAVARVLRLAPDAGSSPGFALAVGEPDARFAQSLAEQTRLHVVCVLDDAVAVQRERQRLLRETNLYGARLSITHVDARQPPPFVPYFANLVVLAGASSSSRAAEWYRALRPCGGVLICANDAAAQTFAAKTAVPKAEIITRAGETILVRGKLPGAFDWDSKAEADERVRWPLEFQWFGEPGCQLLISRHQRPRTPIPANGRLFVFGESHLTAIDAYNGAELWRRRINQAVCTHDGLVTADDQTVHIHDGGSVLQLDAQSGRLRKVVPAEGKAAPVPVVHDLRKPQRFTAKGRQGETGTIAIEATATELRLTLTTTAATQTRNDRWELAFDLRSSEARLLPPGPGTFELVIDAWTGKQRPHRTFAHGPISVDKHAGDPAGTSTVVVALPWPDAKPPRDFALAADVKLWTEDFRQLLWARPLLDGKRPLLNDAEAIFTLAAPPARPEEVLSALMPVPLGRAADLPASARKAGRLPPFASRRTDGDYSADFKAALPEAGEDTPARNSVIRRVPGFELAKRAQPLTGDDVARDYSRSYGCSGTICSAVMDFFRSGTIGMYDRHDDSGMRNVAGIRSGCGMSLMPAGGLLLYSESASDCLCSYSFATSLALVPAEARRNEDWAMFDDRSLTPGNVRQSALNLGAAGDRRDDDGLLWLGYPRAPQAVTKGTALPLPCTLTVAPGFGPYRGNTDRQPIAGTDRPWVYGSGIKGLTQLSMDLVYHQPHKLTMSVGGSQAPKIDGNLTDPCWDGFGALPLTDRQAVAHLRHDAENLYVAYEQKPQRSVTGRQLPWKANVTGRDGAFEKDDHVRLSFRNAGGPRIATFAVTAGGGKYDALLDYRSDLPLLDGITIDGKADDWQRRGSVLELGSDARLRLGWGRDGLLVLAQLPKDYAKGQALTLCLVKPGGDTYQELVLDRAQARAVGTTWKGEKAAPAKFPARVDADQGVIEAQIPWAELEFKPEVDAVAGLLVRVGPVPDVKTRKTGPAAQYTRHDARSGLMFHLRLADKTTRATIRSAEQKRPVGFDVVCTADEGAGWQGEWTAKADADETSFRAELAIPWKTLAAVGIQRERLEVELARPGRWSGPQGTVMPAFARGAVEVHALDAPPAAESYTVRLHFAELDEVKPGERVFDVVVQGRTVLKDFDVVAVAEGTQRAVVREFRDIAAGRRLDVKLVPKAANLTERSAPILSGIEIIRQ